MRYLYTQSEPWLLSSQMSVLSSCPSSRLTRPDVLPDSLT
jgi:hypothetical protein